MNADRFVLYFSVFLFVLELFQAASGGGDVRKSQTKTTDFPKKKKKKCRCNRDVVAGVYLTADSDLRELRRFSFCHSFLLQSPSLRIYHTLTRICGEVVLVFAILRLKGHFFFLSHGLTRFPSLMGCAFLSPALGLHGEPHKRGEH